jgi:two component regulator with propeller domain
MKCPLSTSASIALWLWPAALSAAPIPDVPFWQDVAVRIRHAPELANAVFKKLCVDKENTVYVLTDKGVGRVYEDTLALDKSYRPLAGKIAADIALTPQGDLAYRFAEGWLSNGANDSQNLNTGLAWLNPPPVLKNHPGMPWPELTCQARVPGGAWFGTTRGAFFEREGTNSRYATPSAPGIEPPHFRYYASKRWLRDDHVVDIAIDRDGDIWVLTRTGLNKIEFRLITLATKADWFHRKIRSRNIRYGFTGERRLLVPGDITSSELIDTDNDGGWTSYYIGSLGARYAIAHEEEIRAQAWESFAALERLQTIHTNIGFPARTFERKGFKFSDPDRWRDAPDPGWEWKGHTSSDEVCSQTFAHAVMWELVATNSTERARIATNFVRIVDHILAHDLYLVDVDGKATLWGRWNPEYVNWYPPTIHDRQLNSAELTASLQLAFAMTGNPRYRDKAFEMFGKYGYLTNILSSLKRVAPTPGYVHQGNNMGDEWNHSDDELSFFTYWPLVRFAFTDDLRAKYLTVVREHLEIESPERYPIWNFIGAACGVREFDAGGSVWTLRGTPFDTIAWRITNSHRQDLTKLPPNFMGRQLKELLPPGERLIARINTQPFILDQGDDATDFPGDEFLLGYWLGRYVGAIDQP